MRALSEWFCNYSIPNELQWKGDIECYDKVMERRPNYPKILWYMLVLRIKNKKTKEYFER
jgi:hypothetical protein